MRKIFWSLIIFGMVFLLVNMVPAQSYIISGGISFEDFSIGEFEEKSLGDGLDFLVSLFSIKQIGIVSAEEDPTWRCCLSADEGARICQSVSSFIDMLDVNCDNSLIPTHCDQTGDCVRGCCIDEADGSCTEGSPKEKCSTDGGTWEPDVNCNLEKCAKGCCYLGRNNYYFGTQKECVKKSIDLGTEVDFRAEIATEFECVSLAESEVEGACDMGGGECRFTTKSDCFNNLQSNKFHAGFLCTHEAIDSLCEKTYDIGCAEGRSEIYWYDSCGNRENVYGGELWADASWNNGEVLYSNSINCDGDDCGACEKYQQQCTETKLGEDHVKAGNFVCKSLECVGAPGAGGIESEPQDRANGESWCVFDGVIGGGKDLVGSRHWKFSCINGEVITEGCEDYRGEVCMEMRIDLEDAIKQKYAPDIFVVGSHPVDGIEIFDDVGNYFAQASCQKNSASQCLTYNMEDNMRENCELDSFCIVTRVNVDNDFEFDLCTPKYTKGADLTFTGDEEGSRDMDNAYCGLANIDCPVLFKKDIKGRWQCEKNCDCLGAGFYDEMNNLCVSLGDCGTYVNYVGEGTDNVIIKGDTLGMGQSLPNERNDDYIKTLEGYGDSTEDYKFEKNQRVLPQNGDISFAGDDEDFSFKDRSSEWLGVIGGVGGGMGGLAALSSTSTLLSSGLVWALPGEVGAATGIAQSLEGGIAVTAKGFALAYAALFASAAIMAVATYYVAQGMGVENEGLVEMALAGAALGFGAATAIAGIVAGGSQTGFAAAMYAGGGSGPGIIIAAVIVIILVSHQAVTQWGKTEVTKVQFRCQPWQPPMGGENCHLCHEDIDREETLKVCSEYRCESLGRACYIENADTDKPICLSQQYDNTVPIINQDQVYTEGYEFEEISRVMGDGVKVIVENKTGQEACFQEYETVIFSLNTTSSASSDDDKIPMYTQCKYSFEKPVNYETMEELYPSESNSFLKTHIFSYTMPRLDEIDPNDFTGQGYSSLYGNLRMFVMCQTSLWGIPTPKPYIVEFCIRPGPDFNAVNTELTKTIPESGSYIAFDNTTQRMDMWINEPAECSWSKEPYQEFDEMENNMSCVLESDLGELNGYNCNTEFTELENSVDNNFYIKCKDQPWFGEEEGVEESEKQRVVNAEDFIYTLKGSKAPLVVSSTSPTKSITSGTRPVTVDLSITTSGGMIGDGVSDCNYVWFGQESGFFESGASLHNQPGLNGFNVLQDNVETVRNVPVNCEDDAGNMAEGKISFNLTIDTQPANVVRAYNDGGKLTLVTDELAKCYYSYENECNSIELENMTTMSGDWSFKHVSSTWDPSKTYFIKCKDSYEHINDGCAIIVRPILF